MIEAVDFDGRSSFDEGKFNHGKRFMRNSARAGLAIGEDSWCMIVKTLASVICSSCIDFWPWVL